MINFRKVNDQAEIETVARLALEIWNQHFVPIIGKAQVDYMLDRFQSPGAITDQINDGFEYYLILSDHAEVGYVGLLPEEQSSRIMISKIYIKNASRGLGIGNATIDFVKQLSAHRNINKIWLTVNRENNDTIEWYLRKGFNIVEDVKKDIGNGFYMDDYIMELTIA